MSHFAFITRSEFRTLLEQDYCELQVCFEQGAWKSVHVLGGSIVETLLIDYLLDKPELVPGNKTPLELDLGRAVTVCRSNNILTERTADLCSVIRSYRNLIHPGRQVRLSEPAPSESSAKIVVALLDLIITEIAEARTASFGLTAEQFLSKLERDQSSLVLVPYLLREMHSSELERLLTDVLPSRCAEIYLQLDEDVFSDDIETLSRFSQGFERAFESATEPIKTRVAGRFPSMLKSGDGSMVEFHRGYLFSASYLRYLTGIEQSMVKDYYVAKLPLIHTDRTAEHALELIDYLEPRDVVAWLDPFIRAILDSQAAPSKTLITRKALMEAAGHAPNEYILSAIEKRFEDWARHYESRNQTSQVEALKRLRDEFSDMWIPF